MTPRDVEQAARARAVLAAWIATVPQRCWADAARFDGLVYGSGYSAWGLWAQINTAFVLASSLSWPAEAQDAIPGALHEAGARRRYLAELLRYVVGSHTTGSFETVGGGHWGSRQQAPTEREHFENWHSPIWVTTLAQVILRLPGLDKGLRDAVWNIVAHDAQVQSTLPSVYLDGRAESEERHGFFTSPGGVNSHPESNAWKGSLVSLARMAPETRSSAPTVGFERTLWLSSSACPADVGSAEVWIDGSALRQYQIGTHITDSGAVIHHGVLHPCYSVFALFSRLQTHEFSVRIGQPYPAECERREELLFSTLLKFIVGGRLLYPSGQDWPRWIYGQCYLAPVLAHQQRKSGRDLSAYLEPAVEALLREAHDRPRCLLGHRFERLAERNGWHYDRYEADLAYALALTVEIVDSTPSVSLSTEPTRDAWFHDAAAHTVLARVGDTAVTVSARTLETPFQILLANPANIEQVEWNGCGSYDAGIRDLPDLAEDRSTLESCVKIEHGFRAVIRTLVGLSPQTDGLFELRTTVRAFPEQGAVAILHRMTTLRHAVLGHLDLHCWRVAHGQGNSTPLAFTSGAGRYDVTPGVVAEYLTDSNRLSVEGGVTLVAPSSTSLRWRVRHDSSMRDDWRAVRWSDVCLPIAVDGSRRWRPGEIVCEVPILASLCPDVDDIAMADGVLYSFGEEFDL